MDIFAFVGSIWVILTSGFGTIIVFYLAYIGLRVIVRTGPVRVKEDGVDVVEFAALPVNWGKR